MVKSCARIISELKTLIRLQNGGNFIIDILHIDKILFFNVNGEDQQKKKNKKQKQNSTTAKNNGNTKRCIDKEPCNAGFLITDESLMHFKGLPFWWSQFSFLASSPCRNNDQFTKHTHGNDRKELTIAHIDKTNNYSLMEANCWWMENLELRVHFKEKFMS